MSFEESVRTPVWSGITHKCLLHNLQKQKNYYTGGSFTYNDSSEFSRLASVGSLYIAALNGSNSGTAIGELYVDYTIELQTPQLNILKNTKQFSSFSPGPQAFSSGLNWWSAWLPRFVNTTGLAFETQYDRAIMIIHQRGTDVTAAPSTTFAPDSGYSEYATLVDATNDTSSQGLCIKEFRADVGSTVTIVMGASIATTGVSVLIVPCGEFAFPNWGATFQAP